MPIYTVTGLQGPGTSADGQAAVFSGTGGQVVKTAPPIFAADGRITTVTDPTGAQDAVTKNYHDKTFIPVSCRYEMTSASSTTAITGGAGYVIVDYNSSKWDTDSAVTTGSAWKFTVPSTKLGLYFVNMHITFDSSSSYTTGDQAWLGLDKNSSTLKYQINNFTINGSYNISFNAQFLVDLTTAADFINPKIRFIGAATSRAYNTNSAFSGTIDIHRIGTK